MGKTASEIEAYFYQRAKESAIAEAINGGVYRNGLRPDNSSLEDIVVSFIAGYTQQIQGGEILVNIFVPDIPARGYANKIENKARIGELEALLPDLLEHFCSPEWDVEYSNTPYSLELSEIAQHSIVAKFTFRIANF